jgi:hypothetical protein
MRTSFCFVCHVRYVPAIVARHALRVEWRTRSPVHVDHQVERALQGESVQRHE